jgi:excisionase family DNA binding protein
MQSAFQLARIESNEVFLSQQQQVDALLRMASRAMAGGPDMNYRMEIPSPLFPVLVNILEQLAKGRAVSLVPQGQTLTTQVAANLLGVSRQFFVRLLDEGKLPFHNVGTHRRVYLTDVLAFRDQRDDKRRATLRELTRQQVEDGSYDQVYVPGDDSLSD